MLSSRKRWNMAANEDEFDPDDYEFDPVDDDGEVEGTTTAKGIAGYPDRVGTSMRNRKLIDDYIAHLSKNSRSSQKSIRGQFLHLHGIVARYFAEHHNVDLDGVKAPMVVQFSAYQAGRGMMHATIKTYLSYFIGIASWMFNQRMVEDDILPRKIPVSSLNSDRAKPITIPTYEEILRMRSRQNALVTNKRRIGMGRGRPKESIFKAVSLAELVISSGLRHAEVLQLREGDIEFDLRQSELPFDVEENCPSRYIGGRIILSPSKMKLKNSRTRITYISNLAARTMRKYIEENGLAGTGAPLYPLSHSGIDSTLDKFYGDIITGYITCDGQKGKVVEEEPEPVRRTGYRDIELDDMDISPRFKELIRRRKQTAEEIDSVLLGESGGEISAAAMPARKYKRTASMHTLRHLCSSLLYFRGWNGVHGDAETSRAILGHSRLRMTNRYVHIDTGVVSKRHWVTIMNGRLREYGNHF